MWALRAKTHLLIWLHILHWFMANVFLDGWCKINFSVLYPPWNAVCCFLGWTGIVSQPGEQQQPLWSQVCVVSTSGQTRRRTDMAGK